MIPCVAKQTFDSEAFCCPFYRIMDLKNPELEAEIHKIQAIDGVMIDAKVPAEAVTLTQRLQRIGFRKVSTQVELVHDTLEADASENAAIVDRLDIGSTQIARHAANFVFDRFALDVEVDSNDHDRFYRRWIENSLTAGRHRIAYLAEGFVTFKADGDVVNIDLVSVLAKGKGVGQRLLKTVKAHALDLGCSRIRVTTECENAPAFHLYQKLGFRVVRFTSALHFARGRCSRAP